ncbi:MAG: hypothetical protein BMS9Abin37_0663 [Acidobacteriota bacterium]|nr:MAG: hypothetical protein BMS9Abin37_0663 [Acidobacteriota bacterium]
MIPRENACVSKWQPIARSPIAAIEPVQRHGWEVSGIDSSADLRVMDCTSLTKILVRADPDGAAARFLSVPNGRAARTDQGDLVIGAAPGEWLLLAPLGSATRVRGWVEGATGDEFISVVDRTDARALMRVIGQASDQLLAKLCGIDFHERVTPNGTAFRSSVAKVVTDVVRDDRGRTRSYLLHCEWSSGQYLFDALLDAGGELGIQVDGFRSDGV